MIRRYYMSYWNNRRICSANGELPPAVKRKRYYESLVSAAWPGDVWNGTNIHSAVLRGYLFHFGELFPYLFWILGWKCVKGYWQYQSGDEYKNLIIVSDKVHILIHSVNSRTLKKYLALVNPDEKQLAKINKLRIMAHMPEISTNGELLTVWRVNLNKNYCWWNAVWRETVTYGVGRGKTRRLYQRVTYRHAMKW